MKRIKAVALFRMADQISPDDWETWTHTLEINENTTVGEIVEWMRTKNGRITPENFGVTLNNLDQLKPEQS